MIKLDTLFEKRYGAIRGGQTKLAKDLGVDQSSISSWISGRNKPTRDYIKKMAALFHLTEEEMNAVFNKEERQPPPDLTEKYKPLRLQCVKRSFGNYYPHKIGAKFLNLRKAKAGWNIILQKK